MSPDLIKKHVESNDLIGRAWEVLTSDAEVRDLLRMSNINAVQRLLYNDHGPVHATIVAGSALEIMDILLSQGLNPTSLAHGTAGSVDEAKLIVLAAAYLHDIGNAIHRADHELVGACIAKGILDRLLPEILGAEHPRINTIKYEILHAIHSTSMDVQALTLEASIVKVADATDMAEGRARFPYRKGKADIHALSALAVKSVELSPGEKRPLRITVRMDDTAGFFQIERVLMPKVMTSKMTGHVEIIPVLEAGHSRRLHPIYP
ncbi:MAG: HD domain-containing protein [Desulfurococcales archaeon]|nr:HD domain-containing protein [Desulfurococcales archaeon]